MIRRVVKLSFKPECIEDFKAIFAESRSKISQMEGCMYVEMLQDTADPSVMFTLSIWSSQEALDAYRSSEYFGVVWKRTKALFKDRPQAWSMSPQSHEGSWVQ